MQCGANCSQPMLDMAKGFLGFQGVPVAEWVVRMTQVSTLFCAIIYDTTRNASEKSSSVDALEYSQHRTCELPSAGLESYLPLDDDAPVTAVDKVGSRTGTYTGKEGTSTAGVGTRVAGIQS